MQVRVDIARLTTEEFAHMVSWLKRNKRHVTNIDTLLPGAVTHCIIEFNNLQSLAMFKLKFL